MIVLKILLGALAGFMAHVFTYRPTTHLHGRWGDFTRYWIGSVLLFSVFPLFAKNTSRTRLDDYVIAGVLTSASVGSGVVVAHVFDKR